MKKLVFAMALMLSGWAAGAQNTELLLKDYLAVKNALVSGNSKLASQTAQTLYESVKSQDNFDRKPQLLKAAETLSKANAIDKQRGALDAVSQTLWTLVKKAPKPNQAVYYQYCPMKKTYWLSAEKDIKNPYYGSAMLTCGKTVETKP